MRVAILLPGLHRVTRGAEVAFEAIAQELTRHGLATVTLFGAGQARADRDYHFQHVDTIPREVFERGWPLGPVFRNNYVYEELTFAYNLLPIYQPAAYDVTLACSYPFVNWLLRWRGGRRRPAHVFVTHNGDHPACCDRSEYRWFDCDGLICTNLEYFERNRERWKCALIPNGVDPDRFYPGQADRGQFGLPEDATVALMVSALIPSKRVTVGIQAAAQIAGLHLVVCGDGPERDTVRQLGQAQLGDRFHLLQLPYARMPDLYRAADVLLHLSLDEPFGIIYLEALATGLPIVAHNRALTRWIVESQAVLVDSTDLSALVMGLKQALAQRNPTEIAQRVALIRRRFTWQQVAQQHYDFLQQVMAQRTTQ